MANESINADLLEVAAKLAKVFDQFQIKYALIGGLALSMRTHPRFTRNLDFVLAIPQLTLPSLLEELAKLGFQFDLTATIREWTQHHMVVLNYQGIRIDWLKPVLPAYSHVIDCATDERVLDRTIHAATTEGLILLKLIASRSQDKVDIENLVASSRGSLDVDWIHREWQAIASLNDERMTWFDRLVG